MTTTTVIVHNPIPDNLQQILTDAGYQKTSATPKTTTFAISDSAARCQPDEPSNASKCQAEEFISLPEWCRRVGCSLDAGYRAGRRNQIPGLFRIGKLMRVNWKVFLTSTEILAGSRM